MIDSEFKAWAAGFIDGEGCIYISRKNGKNISSGRGMKFSYSLFLEVSQKNQLPLQHLLEYFECGTISKNNTGSFVWRTTNLKAAKVLQQVSPYLIVKVKEAHIALKFAERKVESRNLPRNTRNLSVIRKRERFSKLDEQDRASISTLNRPVTVT
jgi:LAGLIDADG endonuclease